MKLYLGDCLNVLRDLADASVDSVVTDPPYGLRFMGKKWDYDVPSVELWRQVFRVLKPGGHLLSFGGTRTYHRMVVAIEDAGFEIRDQVMWIYGSGFPKSLDVSKAIDKQAGAEREVTGHKNYSAPDIRGNSYDQSHVADRDRLNVAITAPSTAAAKQWSGWGTALKPANEPIVLARKPLEKGLTVAENVLKWGTGAINVDASRIEYANDADKKLGQSARPSNSKGFQAYAEGEHDKFDRADRSQIQGRWPANVLFECDCSLLGPEYFYEIDEKGNGKGETRHHPNCAVRMLDEQTKHLHGAGAKRSGGKAKQNQDGGLFGVGQHDGNGMRFGDSGGASRFFYVAKTSKRERNAGLEGMPEIEKSNGNKWTDQDYRVTRGERPPSAQSGPRANHHPTVKPIKLMQYLITLITPPGGVVLDPFMGSGSTGCAAKQLGFKFIGIEMNEEYFEIAKRRVAHELSA